jgi:hypothetical protein
MKISELLTERKKKKSSKPRLKKYYYPGYGYYGNTGSESTDGGGDGGGGESINEAPAIELAKKLPSLEKHNYDTIDRLMRSIAKKHKITGDVLHDLFVKRFRSTPDDWIKNKLDEGDSVMKLKNL